MKRISTVISAIVISIASLTKAGANAAIDGVLSVNSSDPTVLAVTPLEGGLFRVDVVGVGQATITVSGDADLGDGVRKISNEFPYEVYDGENEADHFELEVVEYVRRDEQTQALDSADASDAIDTDTSGQENTEVSVETAENLTSQETETAA